MIHSGTIALSDNSDLFYTYDQSSFDLQSINSPNVKHVIGLDIPLYPEISAEYKYTGLTCWLEQETKRLIKMEPKDPVYDTNYNFVFNLNKKQINRYMLLKLVEWFELDNYTYTWSGIGGKTFDMSDMINDWHNSRFIKQEPEDFKSYMLAPIVAMEPRFFSQQGELITVDKDELVAYTETTNTLPWKNFLGDMHRKSGITFIAESVKFDKCTFFTEKTVYSVLAYNFPLWIGGGYAQADLWEKIGFDTFNDVIDHSYQYEESLFDRIYLAFKLNLELIKDYNKIKELRKLHMPRFIKNKQLLLDNQLGKYNNSILETLEPESRQKIVTLINSLFVNQ